MRSLTSSFPEFRVSGILRESSTYLTAGLDRLRIAKSDSGDDGAAQKPPPQNKFATSQHSAGFYPQALLGCISVEKKGLKQAPALKSLGKQLVTGSSHNGAPEFHKNYQTTLRLLATRVSGAFIFSLSPSLPIVATRCGAENY